MDEGIGRILAALQEHGLDENTVVVFTSDNGAERYSDTWPLIGKKMDLLEGGIRVPLIARWPGRIQPNVSTQVTLTMDWVATFLEWAGVNPDPSYPLDGQSLCAHFANPDAFAPRTLYWRMKYRNQRAMREQNWKYLAIEGNEYLFDVSTDPRERANLARLHPDRFERMRADYERWAASMPGIPTDAGTVLAYSQKELP
jgi:arylsulfatase A-like enzyme